MLTSTRRSLFARIFASLAGGAVLANAARAATGAGEVQKVVYHLSDLDKVNFVLGNIKNHIAGKGGPDKVRIVLVIHGPPLAAFVAAKASPRLSDMVMKTMANGVAFQACGNTMKTQNVTRADLLAGFEVAEEGGVTRIADLQSEGYLYLRP
jgi:hypothetical protein